MVTSCASPVKEFEYNDDVGVHRVALFGDNTCIEEITEADTAYTYAGYWSGGYSQGETLSISKTRIGFTILTKELSQDLVFGEGDQVLLIASE